MADTGQVIGGYKLRGLLHTGRESQVWEVVEPTSNRHFAMKVLLPEFATAKAERNKLFNDAAIGMKLRHENVVHVVKVNRSETAPHFIMEYFPSGSIRRRLISRDPKDKEFLKQYAKKIFKHSATGLAYLNASKFVHSDVKPDNIMCNATGVTKIIDFDISVPLQAGFLANLFRKRKQPEGTVSYMSPEQIRCDLLDGRSDVYSLAITWFEMVTGRVPFKGASVGEIFRKHLTEKPPLPSTYNPDVTDEFGGLLLKMLAKKKTDRPKGFHEVLMELRKVKVFKSVKDEDEEQGMM